ncbi:MAG: NifU family protein [Chitinivibrionia bacterium]|nr:NifU family protein [Chitinivibrionia bacterium]
MTDVEKIKEAIERAALHLQSHGGDVQFVSYLNGIVSVQLQGRCGGCQGAKMTLKNVVEAAIREVVPEITGVVAV